ncbi:hypothetical protein HHI36_017699 [Cryptolaemus montrouzieri]|uniref:Molybdenum cofactor sulfurase n=1 Tax=Cryptolaemus montrouzieri TaxID=559131 RepID=A0ABD2NNM7_9CUCU
MNNRSGEMEGFCLYKPVYSNEQEEMIDSEFQRIKDDYFLDHSGGTLYSERQIENILNDAKSTLLCNPHGRNVSSQQTEDAIDIVRYRILEQFHTNSEEYSVVFTSNATAALKLVAETFDYDGNKQEGTFVYLDDNHTSVLGMRSYCKKTKPLTVDEAFHTMTSSKLPNHTNVEATNSLFVYPAQSNFSGTKYPLEWVEKVQNGQLNNIPEMKSDKWFVVLDAASFVSTSDLDLSKYKPDFITISFYKIFGYPTGLGALLVKNSSQWVLKKKYYGGGTVLMAMALENQAVLRKSISERFEDGTIPYLSIISLNHGFETFKRLHLSMKDICSHTFNLARYTYRKLTSLHHSNRQPAAVLYHDTNFDCDDHQGAIVNFNLMRETGEMIGYSEVMHMANLQKIHLRTGCSCNPGACQRHLKLTSLDVKRHYQAGHICGDQNDLIDGIPTGSVRISFGYMSRKKDADAFLQMIEECFLKKPVIKKIPNNWEELETNYRNKFLTEKQEYVITRKDAVEKNPTNKKCVSKSDKSISTSGILKHLLLYPIKSCGAFAPSEGWKVSSVGLEYDRRWMIVNKSGSCVTQKHLPHMCLIMPVVDLQNNVLKLNFPDEDRISLPLHDSARKTFRQCESKICRDKVIGFDCGDAVSQWLNRCLGSQGLRLIEQVDEEKARIDKKGESLSLSFANQSQYLMVNLASVRWLREKVRETDEKYSENLESMLLRFRPNIVVDFGEPFVENELEFIDVEGLSFKTAGSCTRCQMICINQVNAQKTKEPLITLGRVFGGKVHFGVYLSNEIFDYNISSISIGSVVTVRKREI